MAVNKPGVWMIAAGLALGLGAPALAQDATEVPGADIDGVELHPVESAMHSQEPVDYALLPPAGGEHHPIWQDCGFYDRPIITEHVVHSQEHGAVWITFTPALAADQVDALRELATSNTHIVVSPFPDQDSPVIASAWGAQLMLDSADDERLLEFLRAFVGGGPEPGAACSGGTSETVDFPAGTPVATPLATPA